MDKQSDLTAGSPDVGLPHSSSLPFQEGKWMLLRDSKTGMRLHVRSRAGIQIRASAYNLGPLDGEDKRDKGEEHRPQLWAELKHLSSPPRIGTQ